MTVKVLWADARRSGLAGRLGMAWGKHADAGPGRFSCVRGVPCRAVVFYVDLRLAESGRGASGLRLRLFAGRLPLQPPGDDASEYVIPATGCLSGILRPCIVR